jgi:hypothetical protein
VDPRERREDETMAEWGARMASIGYAPSPHTGTLFGTDYSYQPAWTGGGSLNLGWEGVPNLGATVNFDPTAGLGDAYISDYDISGQGMANVGTVSSPDATLGLTAGFQGTGLNRPNAYMDATISDVVPGLTVGAGTDTTPFASYFGDQDSVVPGLGITTTSGGPTDVSYATEVMSLPSGGGVNLNLGTAGGGSGGITVQGTPSDLGTLGRRVWGGITDAVGNIISPAGADASVPEIAVTPTFVEDESAWGAGMAEVNPVPSVPVSQGWPGLGTGYQGVEMADTAIEKATRGMSDERKQDMEDAVHHLDAVYGYATPGLSKAFQQGNTVTNLFDNAIRTVQKWGLGKVTDVLDLPGWGTLPDELNNTLERMLDKREAIGDGLDKSTSDIQDLINNEVFMDSRKSGISKDQMLDSILNQTNTLVALDTSDTGPLAAAATLSQEHGIPITEDKIMEMAFQQDTFKDIPAVAPQPAAPAQPAGPSAADIQRDKQAAVDARNAEKARQDAVNAQMEEEMNARLAQEAIAKQQQQQAVDRERTRMRDIALEQERSALAREQERVRQAAVAAEQSRVAQARRAAEIIQQQQAERTAAEQTARVRREVADMLNAGRDRGWATEAEIDAAIEAQGFDFGGMLGVGGLGQTMEDVGYGGGFAEGHGDTGATGQGGWT